MSWIVRALFLSHSLSQMPTHKLVSFNLNNILWIPAIWWMRTSAHNSNSKTNVRLNGVNRIWKIDFSFTERTYNLINESDCQWSAINREMEIWREKRSKLKQNENVNSVDDHFVLNALTYLITAPSHPFINEIGRKSTKYLFELLTVY